MGLLIDGSWSTAWYDTEKTDGKFVREDAGFRHWITADGAAGPTGKAGFKAESGRYHLYVSHACPWAHRTMIFRHLKALDTHISVSVVHPLMLDNGWSFATDEFATGDTLYQSDFLYQIYQKSKPDVTGRVTVPVLWDKQTEQIVSNESSEIIRMFNSAFDAITGNRLDFWPAARRNAIEMINDDIYQHINNGVYRAGFATKAPAYEEAVTGLFDALDRIEVRLGARTAICSGTISPRLIGGFSRHWFGLTRSMLGISNAICGVLPIIRPCRAIFASYIKCPGVAETVVMPHIKTHYYASHRHLNPTGIVPKGPILDFLAPHGRQR